ncbi:hypothetical protein ABH945_000700 [Paraburkholderia sp. GAS333]
MFDMQIFERLLRRMRGVTTLSPDGLRRHWSIECEREMQGDVAFGLLRFSPPRTIRQ